MNDMTVAAAGGEMMTQADMEAQLLAWAGEEEKKDQNFTKLATFKNAGTYRIRILPDGDLSQLPFYRTFGQHFWKKGLVGNEKTIIFVSEKHTYGNDADPIAKAVWDARSAAKKAGNAAMEELCDKIKAGPNYVVNLMVIPDGQQVGEVATYRINKTMREALFQAMRMISPMFFTLENNICLQIKFDPHQSGNGLSASVVGREPAVDLTTAGIVREQLPNLGKIIEEQIGNNHPASAFTGDILNPLAAAASAAPASTGMVSMAAPAAAPALAAPVAAAPVAAPAAVVPASQVVSPTAAPAAPVAPAPVAAEPVQSPAPAADPTAIAPSDADDLEAKLMSMVS